LALSHKKSLENGSSVEVNGEEIGEDMNLTNGTGSIEELLLALGWIAAENNLTVNTDISHFLEHLEQWGFMENGLNGTQLKQDDAQIEELLTKLQALALSEPSDAANRLLALLKQWQANQTENSSHHLTESHLSGAWAPFARSPLLSTKRVNPDSILLGAQTASSSSMIEDMNTLSANQIMTQPLGAELVRSQSEGKLPLYNQTLQLPNVLVTALDVQSGAESEGAGHLVNANQDITLSDLHLMRQGLNPLSMSLTDTKSEASSHVVRYQTMVQDLQNIIKMNMVHTKPGDVQQIKVKIHPEHLGEIDIQLTSLEGRLTIQLMASSRMALEALDRNLYQLQAILYQQGVQVDRLEVIQQHSGSSLLHPGQGEAQPQTGQQHGQSASPRHHAAGQGNNDGDSFYARYGQEETTTVDYMV
jgi:flagellar hook-length control protein FliK